MPTLTVTAPASQDTLTNSQPFTVRATVSPANATVTLNGAPLTADPGGNVSADVPLNDGLNILFLRATDWLLEEATVSLNVTYDRFPPFLQVNNPVDGALINFTVLEVQGRAEPGSNVTVNGAPALVNATTGNFTLNVTLDSLFSQTDNLLVIRAVDPAGNEAYENRTVTVDIVAPTIDLDLPPEWYQILQSGVPTSAQQLNLRGRTDSGDATITIDGLAAPLTGLSFSAIINISEGPNNITILAVDMAGNARTLTLSIFGDFTAPVLHMVSPASNTVITNQTTLLIEGNVTGETEAVVYNVYVDARGVQHMDPWVTVPQTDGSLKFSFSFDGMVSDGVPHQVALRATDGAGNEAVFLFNYTLKVGKPFLDVQAAAVVTVPHVSVNGSVEAGIETVWVDGHALAVENGEFSYEFALPAHRGNHTFVVNITDFAGNQNRQEITVLLAPIELPAALSLQANGTANLTVEANASSTLSLAGTIAPSLNVTWWVDGVAAGDGPTVTLTLSPGDHNVSAVVANSIENRTFSFTVHAAGPAAGPASTPPAPSKPSPGVEAAAAVGAAVAASFLAAWSRRRRA